MVHAQRVQGDVGESTLEVGKTLLNQTSGELLEHWHTVCKTSRRCAAKGGTMSSIERCNSTCPIRFVLAEVSRGAWAVGHARGLIPGAILRTQAAAVRYVKALGEAAGFSDVDIVIAGDGDSRRSDRRNP
jgi:hypothetical protein